MNVAVVGHVEWIEFVRVESVPRPGEIVGAQETWEEPAGGGGVAAVELARLAGEAALYCLRTRWYVFTLLGVSGLWALWKSDRRAGLGSEEDESTGNGYDCRRADRQGNAVHGG